MNTTPHSPFAALRQFARPEPTERCSLCGLALPPGHDHLCVPGERKLVCACRACAILFSTEQTERHRRVSPKLESISLSLSTEDWAALGVPVGLAFFYHSTATGSVVAVYPSPTGPLESSVDAIAWEGIQERNPALRELEADVEALLVNRIRGENDSFRSSIDHCYHLIGLVRSHWRGMSGGPEMWEAVEGFFSRLRAEARVR